MGSAIGRGAELLARQPAAQESLHKPLERRQLVPSACVFIYELRGCEFLFDIHHAQLLRAARMQALLSRSADVSI
jgi:hypothetical protein